jgi:small subunit ribosomal protein S20
MANSKQQEKRVRTAARQRLENLRYRTQIKTLSRRLSDAAEAGEAEQVTDAHRKLTVLLDRASARGAIHRNKPRKSEEPARQRLENLRYRTQIKTPRGASATPPRRAGERPTPTAS